MFLQCCVFAAWRGGLYLSAVFCLRIGSWRKQAKAALAQGDDVAALVSGLTADEANLVATALNGCQAVKHGTGRGRQILDTEVDGGRGVVQMWAGHGRGCHGRVQLSEQDATMGLVGLGPAHRGRRAHLRGDGGFSTLHQADTQGVIEVVVVDSFE